MCNTIDIDLISFLFCSSDYRLHGAPATSIVKEMSAQVQACYHLMPLFSCFKCLSL